MKKFLAILLTLCMLFSLSVCTASADEELATITVLGYENGTESRFSQHREEMAVWKEMDRMFTEAGLKLEFETIADGDQYKTTIQTRLASAHDLPDLFYGGLTDVTDLLDLDEMGQILKINEVLETTKGNAYNFYYGGVGDQARKLISDENGDFYWIPRIQINQLNGVNAGTSMSTCIRKDWLEKVGLEVPTSLDEFTNAIKTFQEQDVNGSGTVDEYIVEDTSYFSVGMNLWFGIPTCDGTAIGINLTEGTVDSAWYNPNIKAYFSYIQQLKNDGLLYADAIGSDTSTSNLKSNNQVAAEQYYPVGTYEEATMRAAGHEDAYLIGMIPFDAVEGTKGFYSEETPYLVYLRFCVSNSAADKMETMAKLFDVIYSDEYSKLMRWGVEGVNYEVLADGTNHRLTGTMSITEKMEKGALSVNELSKFMLPDFNYNERAEEMSRTAESGWQAKVDYELATADYQPRTPNDNSGYYALGTAEENEILSQYSTDLSTTSREIATNLSLGVYSVDDMDQYIEELRAVGLDEVLAVRRAQFARAQGYQTYEAMSAEMFNN